MDRAIRVDALGAVIELSCDSSVPDAAVDELRRSWQELDAGAAEPAVTLTLSLDGTLPRRPQRLYATTAVALASAVASSVTLRAIERNRGLLVMLHAAGIALDDGRVIAFAGPSGKGKTTLARQLGTRFGYVTDETLAVEFAPARAGEVLPYRKPLSVVTGEGPKRQLAPQQLGLAALPAAPLRLAAIVLLDRVNDELDLPEVEQLELVEGLVALVPQISYLPLLPSPLGTLARLVEETGGIRLLRYREAATVADALPQLLAASRAPAQRRQWSAGTVPVEPAVAPEAVVDEPCYAAAGGADWLDAGDTAVVLHERQVRVLAGVAPGLWRRLREGDAVGLTELTSSTVAQYGPPAGVDPRQAVQQAVHELLATGIVTAVGRSGAVSREAR